MKFHFPLVRRSTYTRVLVELADALEREKRQAKVIAACHTFKSRWRLEKKHEKT